MPLTPGTRFGAYEIIAPLGAGGMGEVYRARDTRLPREVAIKVLAAHLSANPETRARFEREAQAISSLNHPHVCTLFDVGSENGTDYLVMELVEGETLAARLARGALPPADVVRLGAQIADALDRAHRAGVLHRDLKPGNVMLTKSGAKLMDFGLARATGLAPAPGTGGLPESPTMAAPLTAEGTMVGTFQYMPPEQLEGRETDERCDLWAFGCVLYEMATGKPAFAARSQASLISAILTSEPPPVSQVAPLSPPGLDRVVRMCLAKDPEERARSAHDVRLQLLALRDASTPGAVPAPGISPRASRSRLPWIAATIATIAAVALAWTLASRTGAPRGPVLVSIEPEAYQQLGPYPSGVAISPDGSAVVYTARDSSGATNYWLRRFDSPTARVLLPMGTWAGRAASVFWSPDSRSVGIVGNRRELVTVPVEGGSATEVCATNGGRGATWNQHGIIVLAPKTAGPLYKVPASGGEPVQVTWLDSTRHEAGHRFPCFLPDGKHFLFVAMPRGPEGFGIYIGSLDSRKVQRLMSAQSAVTYAPPGYLLFRQSGRLTAQRFDAGSLKLVGDPVPLIDAPTESDLDAEPIATASAGGRLVVLDGPPEDTQLEWLDRSGASSGPLALPPGAWGPPVLSPDDRFALVANRDDLWRIDLSRSVPLRLTKGGGQHGDPVWSPDGKEIAFTTGGRGREEIFIMNADGSGEPRVMPTTDDMFKSVSDWSPAGLIVIPIRGRTVTDVVLAPYPQGAVRPVVVREFADFAGRVSPDGRSLAWASNEAGAGPDLYVQSFPDLAHKTRVTSGGATGLWWMPQSDGLCYQTVSGARIMSVSISRTDGGFEVGTPRLLMELPPGVLGGDLSHDAQRMLVTRPRGGAQERTARVILDWTEMLKR